MSGQSPLNLLIIEDDQVLACILEESLRNLGYSVRVAADPGLGLSLHQSSRADLIILDRMFTGGDGLTALQTLRSGGDTVPVIILTSKSSLDDKLRGLAEGGDDYISKPFSIQELIARIQVIFRRSERQSESVDHSEQWGQEFTVDRVCMRVFRDGRELDITPQEFRLLSLLVQNAGRAMSRSDLLLLGWPPTNRPANTRTVDVYMARLRQKLGTRNGKPLITTIGGEGYKWEHHFGAEAIGASPEE